MPSSPDGPLLSLIARPPACPLTRELWRSEGEPGSDAFLGLTRVSELSQWSMVKAGAAHPAGQLLDAHEYLLYLSDLPVGVKIFRRIDGENIRLLPYTLAVSGSRAGFPSKYCSAWITVAGEGRKATRVRLDTLRRDNDATARSPYRLVSADAGAAAAVNERLRLEICSLGRSLDERKASHKAPPWPVVLCRDVVVDRKALAEMEGVISRLSAMLHSVTGSRTEVGLQYLRPGQDESASAIVLRLAPSQPWISKELAGKVERGFRAYMSRKWPDRWMRLIGPERSALPVVEKNLRRLRCISGTRLGNHALVRAMADLL